MILLTKIKTNEIFLMAKYLQINMHINDEQHVSERKGCVKLSYF